VNVIYINLNRISVVTTARKRCELCNEIGIMKTARNMRMQSESKIVKESNNRSTGGNDMGHQHADGEE